MLLKAHGLVIAIDPNLFTFTIDHNITVYIHQFITEPKLPRKGTEVEIYFHKFSTTEGKIDTIVLTREDDLNCEQFIKMEPSPFWILTRDLPIKNILFLDKQLKLLTENWGPDYELFCNIIKSFIDSNSTLQDFNLKTISNYLIERCPDDVPDRPKTILPHWVFGNIKQQNDDYLLGYIRINAIYGFTEFVTPGRQLRCVIIDYDSKLIAKYVVISNFYIISEYFPKSVVEYLIFKSSKAKIIQDAEEATSRNNSTTVIVKKLPPNSQFNFSTKLTILAKSNVFLNKDNSKECWLVAKPASRQENCFLRLTHEFIPVLQDLEIYKTYTFFHNQPLSQFFNQEIFKIDRNLSQFSLGDALIFDHDLEVPDQEVVLSVSECRNALKTTALFSFEGVLAEKTFKEPLSSRTHRQITDTNFGAPGGQDHVLTFKDENSSINLYLNNWENILFQVGLLPNTKILVRNVVSQKGAYLKCTPFTTFTLLKYKNKFYGCALDGRNWGGEIPSLSSQLIPRWAVVWKRIIINYWCTFRITLEYGFKVLARFSARDCFGDSVIVASDVPAEDLLKIMLNYRGSVYEKWRKHFCSRLTYYNYKKDSAEHCEDAKAITQLLQGFAGLLEVKCIREHDPRNKEPTYRLVEVRI